MTGTAIDLRSGGRRVCRAGRRRRDALRAATGTGTDRRRKGRPTVAAMVFSLRPLMAMRLNAQGYRPDLRRWRPAAQPPMPPPAGPAFRRLDAAAFLDRLADAACSPHPGRSRAAGRRFRSSLPRAAGTARPGRACNRCWRSTTPASRREIIVVDDASEPPLAPALTGLPIRLIRLERNVGQSAARNLAAAEAAGRAAGVHRQRLHRRSRLAARRWCRIFGDPDASPSSAAGWWRRRRPAAVAGVRSGPFAARHGADGGAGRAGRGGRLSAHLQLPRPPRRAAGARRLSPPRCGSARTSTSAGGCCDSAAGACYAPAGRIVHDHRVRLAELLRRRADYGSSEADLQRRHPAGRRVLPTAAAEPCLPGDAGRAVPLAPPLAAALAAAHRGDAGLGNRRQAPDDPAARPGAAGPAHRRRRAARTRRIPLRAQRQHHPLLRRAAARRRARLAAAAAGGGACCCCWRRSSITAGCRRPCALPAFVGLYWLEMAAYQWGVWRGCLAQRRFHPLLPILNWRR